MKYVIFHSEALGFVPLIFGERLVHAVVAEMFTDMHPEAKVYSAGFVDWNDHGLPVVRKSKSESLRNVPTRGRVDEAIIYLGESVSMLGADMITDTYDKVTGYVKPEPKKRKRIRTPPW